MTRWAIFLLSVLSWAQGIPFNANGMVHAAAGGTTFALVQHTSKATCAANALCTITVTATGTGHLLVLVGTSFGGTRTFSSASGDGTWTHCTNAYVIQGSSYEDCAFILSSTGGATSIDWNWSGSPGGTWTLELLEYSRSSGSFTRDTDSNLGGAACTSCVGVPLTLAGSNEIIVQFISPGNSCSAISGSYTTPADFPGGYGVAGWISANSGTAPTWTCVSGVAAMGAVAFQ